MSDGMAELGFNDVPRGQILLVNDVVEANGCFLLHHLTSMAVRAEQRVCMLALSNSVEQYTSVGRKMGVNVQAAIAQQRWLHIDGFSRPYDWCATAPTDGSFSMTDAATTSDLHALFLRVQSFVAADACVLVIDDLTALAAFYGVASTLAFVRYCRHLALTTESTLLMLVHGDVDCEDHATAFIPAVTDLASTVLTVRGLESGYCKDIHGSVTVTPRRQPSSRPVSSILAKTLQFKLVESGMRSIRAGLDV
ncbi:hypothetical protein SPRG_19768 [Saprolegnia parasitica CBS 223.65]|uniref:Elongator complex protein 6 n=1 Tax=Saprolegnia parasitica (strain CBS 223.65) TaxID=695850 RepID=A0A067CTW9_SAPPC|nr:hypothetical protein SPRG_19768 [Saprolegnia parasitica CBS 223.65]KDO30207.1 hypothetical protein SPRG_19768 [Saprolegnia parasitica CBS 223.65]|eukprot:XP_012199023.1 hypothetical protein SPRG_19768 [Saprolegnia parasitica CBS 223.65]